MITKTKEKDVKEKDVKEVSEKEKKEKFAENVKVDTERRKALDLALQQIEKQFGKGSIMKLGTEKVIDVDAIPTGALGLDIATGIGGMPRGRAIEIFGPESSGKTTLTLSIIAQLQKTGGVAAFIDAEHALDAEYARRLKVKIEDLIISQPDSGEQALQIVEMLVKSNAVDLIVVDSVAALIPRLEIEGEIGDVQVGLQARLMSQAMRKLTSVISKTNTCLIFINQIREKIGVMFGNPETTPGGRALKFYASMRLDIRRIGTLKEGEVATGTRVRVKVVKNKCAAPFRFAEFDILFNEGISYEGSVIDLGVESHVIEKQGSWLSYKQERLGQGRENARAALKGNTKLLKEIEDEIRAHASTVGNHQAAEK